MANKAGNWTRARPSQYIVAVARELSHLPLWEVALMLQIGKPRLRRLAEKYGLTFSPRRVPLTDEEVAEAIRNSDEKVTLWNLARQLGARESRVASVAEKHGLSLAPSRTSPKAGIIHQVNGYWVKLCPHCDQEKGIENFWECESSSSGLDSWCKSCVRARLIASRATSSVGTVSA